MPRHVGERLARHCPHAKSLRILINVWTWCRAEASLPPIRLIVLQSFCRTARRLPSASSLRACVHAAPDRRLCLYPPMIERTAMSHSALFAEWFAVCGGIIYISGAAYGEPARFVSLSHAVGIQISNLQYWKGIKIRRFFRCKTKIQCNSQRELQTRRIYMSSRLLFASEKI